MDPKQLFRQSAIDKAASPEQLDAQMEVTSPKGWIALSTTGLLILGTIAWSIVGRIPDKVAGNGVILGAAGSLREVVAPGSGEISELRIEQGDTVEEGEVVAIIDLPSADVQVDDAEENARAAEREYEAVRLDNQAATNRYRNDITRLEEDIDNARAGISRSQEQLEAAQQDLERIQQLYERELATINQVRQAESRVSSLEGEIDRFETQINRYRSQISRARDSISSLEARTRNSREQMLAARRQLENARRGVGVQSDVRSPVAGRVMQLLALANSTVSQGQVLARVAPETTGGDPSAPDSVDTVADPARPPTLEMTPIFAVPSDQAGMIEAGQPVEINLGGVRREEYGYLVAEVLSRAPLPEGAEDFAGRRGLPEGVARDLGSSSVIEVVAKLFPADTPSGFRWSGGTGPPYQISPGTTIDAQVRVRETAPIELVIPTIRSWFGS